MELNREHMLRDIATTPTDSAELRNWKELLLEVFEELDEVRKKVTQSEAAKVALMTITTDDDKKFIDEFQEYPWLSEYWRKTPGLPEPFRHEFQLIWNRLRDNRLLIDALVKEGKRSEQNLS